MTARQFLNVVMGPRGGCHTVSRFNAKKHLFYPSTAEAQAAAAAARALPRPWLEPISRMPAPKFTVRSAVSGDRSLSFLPFYDARGAGDGGNSKILCIDTAGHTVLLDAGDGSVLPVPSLLDPKSSRPFSFTVSDNNAHESNRTDAFYVMGSTSPHYPCSFEALTYRDGRKTKGWHWDRLPPTPGHILTCHTILETNSAGDPILCVSSGGHCVGTYCYNTVSNRWFEIGSWALPFCDRAVHVPELGKLWFGLANNSLHHFIVADLSTLNSAPTVLHDWQDLDDDDYGDWFMEDCSMVYLGSGRFCIARYFVFGMDEYTREMTEEGVVISGVEVVVVPEGGSSSRLEMVKHKSRFYNFDKDEILCVL